MEKVEVIKITKEFEKENVVNAVKAYMTPKDENRFRLESECMGETYIVRLLGKKPKTKKAQQQLLPDEWDEHYSVKLSFDEDTCTVSLSSSALGPIGIAVMTGMTAGLMALTGGIGIIGLMTIGGVASIGGSYLFKSKGFEGDIITIVKSFICDEIIIEEKGTVLDGILNRAATAQSLQIKISI